MLWIYNSSWNRSPKNHQQIGGFSDLYSLFQHNVDSTENSLLLQSFRWRFLRVGNALACPPKTNLKLTKSPLLIVSGVGVYPSHLGSKYNRFNKMYASQQISFITLDPSSPQKEIWHQLTSYLSAVTVFLLLNFYPSAFPMLRPLRPPTQETRLRKL